MLLQCSKYRLRFLVLLSDAGNLLFDFSYSPEDAVAIRHLYLNLKAISEVQCTSRIFQGPPGFQCSGKARPRVNAVVGGMRNSSISWQTSSSDGEVDVDSSAPLRRNASHCRVFWKSSPNPRKSTSRVARYGWSCCYRFQIRPHDVMHAANLGVRPELIHGTAPRTPAFP